MRFPHLTIRAGVWLFPLLAALLFVGSPAGAAPEQPGTIICFGDSLTAGYGLDPDQAWPALIEEKIRAKGWPFRVVNAGLSGETTAAGARRVNWILRQPVAVFILALGGNDGLRGIPTEETERNLQAIIDAVRRRHPEAAIILAGMEAPPNMGPDFTRAFRALFPRLAERNALPLIPFLLAGVAAEPALNQPDGIHPNAEGQRRVADNVWAVLERVLQRRLASD